MAQRVITTVVYTDDLTGEEFTEGDGETVSYGLDGATYEVDLLANNAKELREFLARYTAVSRKTVDTRGRTLAPATGRKKGRRTDAEMELIRTWAWSNGYSTDRVPERGKGRIPWEVTEAYERAMRRETQA